MGWSENDRGLRLGSARDPLARGAGVGGWNQPAPFGASL